jgi:glycosyltransferase involved in cell wall biosynthesis
VTSETTVSIVITCYNQASFLADAIRSALAQSVDPNFDPIEVVVVDDGSTDQTRFVAEGFPRVRYLFQPNRGLAAARNSGIAASKGRYVCFLDADDTLLPRAIGSGLRAFDRHPQCAFVYGDFCDVDAHGVALSAPRGPRVAKEHYRALLEGNFIGMHATVLYRRCALQSVGGFDVRLGRCEDYEIYLRLTRKFPVREHASVVAHYRWHDGNMSRDHGAMLNAAVDVLKMQKPHLRGDAELRRAARRGIAIWRQYYGERMFLDFRRQFEASGLSKSTRRSLRKILLFSPRVLVAGVFRMMQGRLKRALSLPRSLPPIIAAHVFGDRDRI